MSTKRQEPEWLREEHAPSRPTEQATNGETMSRSAPHLADEPGPYTDEDIQERPQIRVSTEVTRIVDAAEGALLQLPDSGIYQRGPCLVRIVRDGAAKLRGIIRPPGGPVISPLPDPVLLERLASAARWVKLDKRTQAWAPCLPPSWVVGIIQARGEWEHPHLEAVTESPVLRPDGTVLEQPGHDDATGILYDPGPVRFPSVPLHPTREDAIRALGALGEPYSEFPFATGSDYSAALAVPLTILARPAIAGPTPLFGHTAPTPGSGKGLMVNVSSIIATGRRAAIMTAPKDVEEAKKIVLSLAIEGCPVVAIDNVSGRFGNDALAGALTAYTYKGRHLGFNKTMEAPMSMVWTLTGNNVIYQGDLQRRVVRVHIDPRRENPEDRTDFRHPDLCAYALCERPRLVVAALTVLRAFIVAGRPKHGKPPFGSFEDWDALVRGALIWAAGPDPLDTRAALRAESDSDLDGLRAALAEWHDAFGTEPRTAAQAIERAEKHPDMKAALSELADCPVDRLDSRRLGYRLRTVAGRIVGGLSFERDKEARNNVMRWTVHDSDCEGCRVCR